MSPMKNLLQRLIFEEDGGFAVEKAWGYILAGAVATGGVALLSGAAKDLGESATKATTPKSTSKSFTIPGR